MKKFFPVVLLAAVVWGMLLFFEYSDFSEQKLITILGFLTVSGFFILHEKLTKIILPPRDVSVEVRYKIELRDDDLEFDFLEKIVRFPVVPRVGDQVSVFGSSLLEEVTSVRLFGYGDELDGTPQATVWCEKKVRSTEEMQKMIAEYKEAGWRIGYS